MLQRTLWIIPHIRIKFAHSNNYILAKIRNIAREKPWWTIDLFDLLHVGHLSIPLFVERVIANNHLVYYDTTRKNIDLGVVRFSLNLFWSHVEQSPNFIIYVFFNIVSKKYAQSEVYQFDLTVISFWLEDYVFWLDISMNKVFWMGVGQSWQNILHYCWYFLFIDLGT